MATEGIGVCTVRTPVLNLEYYKAHDFGTGQFNASVF
jgi:hypothetical protein